MKRQAPRNKRPQARPRKCGHPPESTHDVGGEKEISPTNVAGLQGSPFLTVEDWRRLLDPLFSGEDKCDDADRLARYIFLASEAIDQRECQLVKASLLSALRAAKEFGRFPQIELKYYRAYLLGDLQPEREMRFRAAAPVSKSENRSGPRSVKKKH
jgi:hypothetical protein